MDETSEIDGLPFRGVLEDLPIDLLIGWSASLLTYVSKHSCHRFPAYIFPKHVSYRFGSTTWNFITCQLPFWINDLEFHYMSVTVLD